MEKTYDLAVFGATFAGLGVYYGYTGSALVIDSTPQLGHEFIGTLKPVQEWKQPPILSEKGRQMYRALCDSTLMQSDGQMFVPEIGPFLYHMVWTDRVPMLLSTEIVSCRPVETGYEIELYNQEGLSMIQVKKIIDTTVGAIPAARACNPVVEKWFYAVLFGSQKLGALRSGAEVLPAGKAGYQVLRIKADGDYRQARAALHCLWVDGRQESTIARTADYFACVTAKKMAWLSDGYQLLPSCNFDHPILAFEEGIQRAGNI